MFAYCGNNPVSRIDSTGHKWYHWAIAAAVVVVAAAAVVVTAGAAAPALVAVASVANGIAATTTASTVAAGVFLGSSVTLGAIALDAAADSGSAEEFAEHGDWGTVRKTVGGGLIGGVTTYLATRTPRRTPVIGKMSDLEKTKLKGNEFKVADLLDDMGNPKANWKNNSGVLRSLMDGGPIRDVSPYPMVNAGFLGLERNLLQNHGYVYQNGYWIR